VCRKHQRPAQKKQAGRLKKRIVKVESSDTESENDNDNDNDIGNEHEDEDEEYENQEPSTKSPAIEMESDDDENHQDNNDQEANVDNKHPPRRKRGKNKAGRHKYVPIEFRCPSCQKDFSTLHGLEYHVNKQVCQRAMRDGAAPKAKFKRPAASQASGKNWKQFRGDEEDRTCSKCKRVFTSVLGKDYHCVNRVCEQKKSSKVDATQAPFPALNSVSEFVTRWVVVRVIQDGRATPSELGLDKDAKDRYRLWKNQKSRLDLRRKEQYLALTVHSLARRKRFGKVYAEELMRQPKPPPHTLIRAIVEDEGQLQREVWKIYTGATKRGSLPEGMHRNFPMISPEYPYGGHPLEPPACHPDRIVKCVLIPDRRKLIALEAIEDRHSERKEKRECRQVEKEIDRHVDNGTKLFLQRRMLTEPYVESGTRFCCVDCGRLFASIVGCKYHVNTWACHRPSGRSQQKPLSREDLSNLSDHRSELLMERQDDPPLWNGGNGPTAQI
jgi:hypothetical protein